MISMLLLGCSGMLDDTFFLRVDGADLLIDAEGNPEPGAFILFLHGGPGGSGQAYNLGTWAERLEAEAVMVYLDQRGQGASQGSYSPESITIDRMVDDVIAVIGALKARYGDDIDLYLMGHSWGGLLGCATLLRAETRDELVGWIEIDGAHDVPLLNQYAVPMLLDQGREELEAGRNEVEWTEIVSFAEGVDLDRLTSDDSLSINRYAFEAEGLIEGITWDDGLSFWGQGGYLLASPESLLTAQWTGGQTNLLLDAEIEQTSLTDQLDRIDLPSLMLWGAYDFVVPVGLGEDAETLQSNGELVVLETSGHSPMFNQPNAVADNVLAFIEQTRTE
ncbi:MAG: pimeloyl-ACP methyl ester carboxylesterase [Myxococcota bacterium]|jgi:pimeloyl-ACP methyl ester carboxylesterase